MYCSLQEAYQIPVFATRRKKTCGAAPEGEPAGAFDPYGSEEGMGGLSPAYRKYGREDFTDSTAPATANSSQIRRVMGNTEAPTKNTTGQPIIDSVAYTSGKASDYDYYKRFGLQFPNIQASGLTYAEGFADANPKPKEKEQCGPHDATYRIPISDDAKKNYDAAMNIAINQPNQPMSTQQVLGRTRTAEMKGVDGYYDEDLDNFLRVSDMKAAPTPAALPKDDSKEHAEPYDPKTSPFATAITAFKGQLTPPSFRTENMAGDMTSNSSSILAAFRKDYVMDLVLFVLSGLLFIFLCDQLYRLAAMTGMRDTIDFIKPFLTERNPAPSA
jgi:hypothetical protein